MKASKDKLYKACKAFIDRMEITCPETIYQTDRVAEDCLPFIEEICDIVGYLKLKDD